MPVDDWSGAPSAAAGPPTPATTTAVADDAGGDAANSGIRREPELPVQEEIVAPPAVPQREFDFVEDDAAEANAVRARRAQEGARRNARVASLDPDDGIAL